MSDPKSHSAPDAKPAHEAKPTPSSKAAKGGGAMPGGCLSWGCKVSAHRFNFCDEHYEHFKFGLIKKTGEPVSDYDKKFEHFVAHQSKRAHKVA